MGKIYFECEKCSKLLGETKEGNGYKVNQIHRIKGTCCYKSIVAPVLFVKESSSEQRGDEK